MIKLRKKTLSLFSRILILIVVLLSIFVGFSALSAKNEQAQPIQRTDELGYVNYSSTMRSFPNQKNVLFFNANWCSTCTAADLNFQSEIRSIPSYLTIYKVDFSSAISLRQKYSVTVQHTFVQVDAMGNELKKWVGSYTIDDVLKQLV